VLLEVGNGRAGRWSEECHGPRGDAATPA